MKESLRIVAKPVQSDNGTTDSLLQSARSSSVVDNSTEQTGPTAGQVRSHSKLNERPLTVDLPGMAKNSMLNRR